MLYLVLFLLCLQQSVSVMGCLLFLKHFNYFSTLKGKHLSISLSLFIWLKSNNISLETFNESFVPNGVFSELNWNLTKKKYFCLDFFHMECWDSRCVLSPPFKFETDNIQLNFILKSFDCTFALIMPSMECDWII